MCVIICLTALGITRSRGPLLGWTCPYEASNMKGGCGPKDFTHRGPTSNNTVHKEKARLWVEGAYACAGNARRPLHGLHGRSKPHARGQRRSDNGKIQRKSARRSQKPLKRRCPCMRDSAGQTMQGAHPVRAKEKEGALTTKGPVCRVR